MENYSIYKHTCPNGKIYIGITKQKAEARWNHGHGYDTQFFGKAVKKYGWENIQHEVLMNGLTLEMANSWEQALISQYKSYDPQYGYNLTMGGDGQVGRKATNKLREATKKRVCAMWQNPAMREKLLKHLHEISQNNKGRKMSAEAIRKRLSKISKPIVQYDLTGKKIASYPSIAEAGRQLKVSDGWIVGCCKGYTKRRTVCGTIFKYANEPLTKDEIERRLAKDTSKNKPVYQMDFDGNIIQVHPSMHEADRVTGISYKNIFRACNSKTHIAKGYKWQYAIENNSDKEAAI